MLFWHPLFYIQKDMDMRRSGGRMSFKTEAIREIDEKKDLICGISDSIWDHPELGYHEDHAARTYIDAFRAEGFEVEEDLKGIPTAFMASYGHGRPIIGLLAEFDALDGLSQEADLREKKPVCEGGAGHGCGHNLLGAAVFASALAVKKYLELSKCEGTIRFYGCPAEEGGAGKGFLSRDGAFDDLDAALTWHPGDLNAVSMGSTLANYQICYHFTGKSSHAGISPELGRSALDACELMNVGVQFLREHVSTQCRIHYAILNSGGRAPGVVQANADVLYLMRAPDLKEAKDLRERVDDIARGAALMTSTKVDIEFIKACSNTLPNRTLSEVLQKNMDELGAPKFDDEDRAYAESFRATMDNKSTAYYKMLVGDVPDKDKREELLKEADAPLHEMVMPLSPVERSSAASSDVGDVSVVCPTAQISMATMPNGTAFLFFFLVAVGKSPLAKKGMLQAGRIIAGAAMDLFADPDKVKEAKAEMEERTGGAGFESPIPKDVKPPMNR